MPAVLTNIRTKYNTLSKTQKTIADFILNNKDRIPLLSITEVAKNCNTSETTVMRFLKKLDYDSYQIFRIDLTKEVTRQPSDTINEELSKNDDLKTIRQKIIAHTQTAISDINASLSEETLAKTVKAFRDARNILLYGVGASSAVTLDAFHKFANIGLSVVSYPDPHLTNIICSHATLDDAMLAVSHTGESNEVNHAVKIARANGVKIIGMTSFANSTLASLSDICLLSSTNERKYHSEAMASRIVQLTIIDIIYTAIYMSDEEQYFNALNDSRKAVSLNKT